MSDKKVFELHIPISQQDEETGLMLINALEQACKNKSIDLSKSALKLAISKGALWLTKGKHTARVRRLKKNLKRGETLHFYYNEAVLNMLCPEAKLVDDLNDYSVWYKPYGMLSQGSKWSDHCTISRFAQLNLPTQRSTFIVHRLDRAATGLILVAHTKQAARLLSAMFEQHNLEKHYQIIVHGDHRLRSQPDIIELDVDEKKARSTFNFLTFNEDKNQSKIDVKIDSGRKHQIRIHASNIGFPVVGDRLYGDKAKIEEGVNLQLCATSLRFKCPLSEEQKVFTLPSNLTLHL
jgi:tRNA pseudouridine32 synthase/23S rRNA pseudouridine746 synthase